MHAYVSHIRKSTRIYDMCMQGELMWWCVYDFVYADT